MTDLRKAAEMALEALEMLWDILDDIDTASDMAKENDAWYRKRVEALQKKRWDTTITTDGYKLKGGPVEALRQALDDKPAVKSYAGGKPNYCTPVDAVSGFTVTEPRQSLSRMKPGDRFVLVRTGEICHIENDGSQWNETAQRPSRFHKNSQVRLIVDGVNMSQERVDETAKRDSSSWVGLTDDEIVDLACSVDSYKGLVQATEAKLKEKNT